MDHHQPQSRRQFFDGAISSLGTIALASLLGSATPRRSYSASSQLPGLLPHFAPKANRVVCLFQSGGVSHIDLFDHKPELVKRTGEELPASIKGTQRVTGMTSGQAAFPIVGAMWPGRRCGESGHWISDQLPHLQGVADDLCFIKSMNTEAINHDPGITWMNTGNQQPGYASMGAWISYGLGSMNEDLPTFIAMLSQGTGKNPDQPLFSRLWGSGFLPSSHQGVALRPGTNPVLYLKDPPGVNRFQRRHFLDDLRKLNEHREKITGDPEITSRIKAYEMAYRLQVSAPELSDVSRETADSLAAYGPEVHKPGTYAANCLLARRMLERGVRFVQLFHRGWDQHIAISRQLPNQCRDIDQPTAALIKDLKQRGLLEDTLVMFVTEFGRTAYSQGAFGSPGAGRDHHGRCFTIWLAGGGVRAGLSFGSTDDYAYNITENPVHIRDLHATLLHILGIDHERLTYPYRGLDARLSGVEPARIVREIFA